MLKISNKIIPVLACILILDPLLRLVSFKLATGYEWSLVWDNIIENGNVNAFRFLEFWLLTPLAGLFLLTLSQLAYGVYSILTLYKFYNLMTYESYSWPYFSETPHFGAFVIISLNMAFVLVLFWPILKKYVLSYYFKDFWDARGRYECHFKATLFMNQQTRTFNGYVKNISSGGVLFHQYEVDQYGKDVRELKVQDKGHIVIQLTNGEFLSFDIRLANVSIVDKADHYGMEFVDMDPKKSLVLMNVLLSLMSKKNAKEEHLQNAQTIQ